MDQPEATPDNETREKKARVFTEEAKQRQVTHWDWDYLPREELDRRLAEDAEDAADDD